MTDVENSTPEAPDPHADVATIVLGSVAGGDRRDRNRDLACSAVAVGSCFSVTANYPQELTCHAPIKSARATPWPAEALG
jgi:hypothetical protein